jgi:hypothetical protein
MLGRDTVVIPVLLFLAQPLAGAGGEKPPATAIENASYVDAPFRFSVEAPGLPTADKITDRVESRCGR